MKILAFSEHFFPRVGGTVEYVHQTCQNLQALGHEVHLIVPSDENADVEITHYPYRVTGIGVGWPKDQDPSREIRYHFCIKAHEFALACLEREEVDIIHVLFGLFLNEVLDISEYRKYCIPSVTTIHNVPPKECARSWPGDQILEYGKDWLRLKIVAIKNKQRLNSNIYDKYIVPSHDVESGLRKLLPAVNISVIGHGYSEILLNNIELPKTRCPMQNDTIRLLTVGGWVPHKRQHLIPEIAARLRDAGLNFCWDLVGPSGRVPRYQKVVQEYLSTYQLDKFVNVHDTVPQERLSDFYHNAHLYIQPSTEEGFCMTALDAAAAGIPVIACPTGALPEITSLSGGVLVTSQIDEVTKAILHFVSASLWNTDAKCTQDAVREQFNWEKSVEKLESAYTSNQQQSIL